MSQSPESDSRSLGPILGVVLVLAVIGGGVGLYMSDSLPLQDGDEFDYPEGTNAEGVNMSTFAQTHNNTLSQTTHTYNYQQITDKIDGTSTIESVRVYGEDDIRGEQNVNGTLYNTYFQSSTDTVYQRKTEGDTVSYTAESYAYPATQATGAQSTFESLRSFETEFVNITTVDGTQVVTYRFVGHTEEAKQASESRRLLEAINVSGTITITEDGYARDVQVTSEAVLSENQSLSIRDVGSTTATEPEWVTEAVNQTE